MTTSTVPYDDRSAGFPDARRGRLDVRAATRRVLALPELLAVLAVAGVLNLWDLQVNGYANTFYAAAVKSMASSWHDFLFASMDKSGLMTVDKPPLALWVQALSARIFGFGSLSILVPSAIEGIVAAGLMYDLVRRRFGRAAGFVAGIVLATTPTIVAMSRHNNPDELLVTLSVAAVWFALRAFETGRTRDLVWCGVFVGLGFETKMGVALMIVPGIALGWLWMRSEAGAGVRANLRLVGQLLWGGLALVVVGLAWPILVTIVPSADRPWISGTSDNSIWSLITGYNGLGRIAGQAGGPAGGGGFGAHGGAPTHPGGLTAVGAGHGFGGGLGGGMSSVFGGGTGVFRLIGSSLGSQAGWLLGFAVVAAIGLIVLSRLRRSDRRTGFVIALGGALLITGVVFSFASGIFHPYYVSCLAPWAAAIVGAGVGELLPRPLGVARTLRSARLLGPVALLGGMATELVVLHEIGGQLGWATPLVIALAVIGAALLALGVPARVRAAVVAVAFAGLLAAPATWAAETLNHATSSTFPTGGPASAEVGGFGGGGSGGGGFGGRPGFVGAGGGFARAGRTGFGGGRGGFASKGGVARGAPGGAPPAGAGASGTIRSLFGGGFAHGGFAHGGFAHGGFAHGGFAGGRGFGGAGGGFGGAGAGELEAAAKYADAHGGGTVAVESQSTAAEAIVAGDTNVAGIGGFSGVESTVSAAWIAQEVREGRLSYILATDSGFGNADGREGSKVAIATAEKAATKVTFTYDGQKVTLYDLKGRAAAILAAAHAS